MTLNEHRLLGLLGRRMEESRLGLAPLGGMTYDQHAAANGLAREPYRSACGKFSRLKPRFEGTPGTKDFGCRMVAKDLSDGEECIGALITLAMADAEGWSKKNGSKWRTMPEQMLMYRAAAFWTRRSRTVVIQSR